MAEAQPTAEGNSPASIGEVDNEADLVTLLKSNAEKEAPVEEEVSEDSEDLEYEEDPGEEPNTILRKVVDSNGNVVEVDLSQFKESLTVDGDDVEVGFEELLKGYSNGKASNNRYQEAIDRGKKAEDILRDIELKKGEISSVAERMKNDPRGALIQLYSNNDPSRVREAVKLADDLLERQMASILDERMASEEVRASRARSMELDERERQINLKAAAEGNAAKRREEVELDKQAEIEKERLQNDLEVSFKNHNVPEDALSLRIFASIWESAKESGVSISPDQVGWMIAQERSKFIDPHVTEKAKSIRKKDVANYKEGRRVKRASKAKPKQSAAKPPKKRAGGSVADLYDRVEKAALDYERSRK